MGKMVRKWLVKNGINSYPWFNGNLIIRCLIYKDIWGRWGDFVGEE